MGTRTVVAPATTTAAAAAKAGAGVVETHYKHALQRLGATQQLPPQELFTRYPPPPDKTDGTSVSDDVALAALRECTFYRDFSASPAKVNAAREAARQLAVKKHGEAMVQCMLHGKTHYEWKKERRFDFRLQPHEAQRLAQHGIAVSQRLRAESFAEVYYRLYTDDMPVFVTADSILHAWHRSFDAALVDIETLECVPALERILRDASAQCRELLAHSSDNEHTHRVLLDIDAFLSVAQSLLNSTQSASTTVVLPANAVRVATLTSAVHAQRTASVTLFGSDVRAVDFSLFTPRGHYTKSETLTAYFRAMTWLGSIDLRVAGATTPSDMERDLQQLQCAVALVALLRASNGITRLGALDTLITSLVGDGGVGADSLTPAQLDALLPPEMSDVELLAHLASAPAPPALVALQREVVARALGVQRISGHPHVENCEPMEPTALPTAFAMLGQRFAWSSFVFSRLVFDQVVHEQSKVVRRMPSAVDVGFALLGNNAAGAVAAARMTSSSDADADADAPSDFVPLRDGVPYTSNLLALRESIDAAFEQSATVSDSSNDSGGEGKDESVSTLWLRALRALSAPAASPARVFHSKTWQLRQLNAQLASFTQLRHDSVLYTKQSYTMGTRCEYAAGYVDPYPQFYVCMQALASRMAQLIERLKSPADDSFLKDTGASVFTVFAETMQTLAEIAALQARKEPLSDEQTDFVKTVMEERFGSGGTKYAGWYPRLFYAEREDAGKRDVLVADVHTDVPSIEHGDPHGGVLHLGVGDVNFGFFVVDNVVYSGPVFSSYEFVSRSANERLNDAAFKARVDAAQSSQLTAPSALASPRISKPAFGVHRLHKRHIDVDSDGGGDDAETVKDSEDAAPVLSAPDWALASFLC